MQRPTFPLSQLQQLHQIADGSPVRAARQQQTDGLVEAWPSGG